MSMANRANQKRDLDTSSASPEGHRESYTTRVASPRASYEMELDESDPSYGDRVTPVFFDCPTPIFSEAAVREVMARADAAERASRLRTEPVALSTAPTAPVESTVRLHVVPPVAAPVVMPSRPTIADDDDVACTSLHTLGSRGRHVSLMLWVVLGLILLMMAAVIGKVGQRISQQDPMPSSASASRA